MRYGGLLLIGFTAVLTIVGMMAFTAMSDLRKWVYPAPVTKVSW